MSVARVKELPYPEKKFESHEDAWEYCKELRNSLQEEQSERIEDFDVLKIDNMGWEDVRAYAKNATKQDGLANAISKISTTEKTLLISNQQDVTADATIPSTMTLRFKQGGSLNISSGKTVTINGQIEAGLFQIFEGSGAVLFGTGATQGLRPEWWGGLGDDSTDCTAAFASANTAASTGVVAYGVKKNILLSQGVYRVTQTSGNYAVTVNCPIIGEGADVSIIENIGTGSALHIVGVNGEIYYSRWKNFSVVGNASSEDGITLNVTATLGLAVGYSIFENIDSHDHGQHGLVHDGSWATKYINCKSHHNLGLGVYLPGTGAYSQHNNVIFQNCDSRWNGGTGDRSADFDYGGVRISGKAVGVYWLGGVVESNNAWGFIVGEDAVSTAIGSKVVIRDAYGEGSPTEAASSTTGGFFYLSANYSNVSVSECTIAYGATTGKTGYVFYVAAATATTPGFKEWNNDARLDLRAGTATRDYGITYADKWGSATEIINLQADRDFSGTNHWVNGTFASFDSSGDLSVTSNATQYCYLPRWNINNGMGFVYGKRYGMKYNAGASGTIYFGGISSLTRLPAMRNGNGQAHEFIWLETNANQSLFLWSDGVATANIDNISIYEIDGGVSPQSFHNGLLSTTIVTLGTDKDTAIYIVPTGKRCVLSHAILVAGSDAGATSQISIGLAGAETDFIPANTLSNLDAANDAVILRPIPNTTPLKGKSYAAGSTIETRVTNQSGGAVNTLYLYGLVY